MKAKDVQSGGGKIWKCGGGGRWATIVEGGWVVEKDLR